MIPVEVRYQDQSVLYEVLVDSGADGCFFDRQIADALGIDVDQGEAGTIQGITGEPRTFYKHTIELSVGGHTVEAVVGFMELPEEGHGAVGQQGFFEHFVVKFDYQKKEVEIKPHVN